MEFLECIPGLLIPSSSQYHCISQSYGYYGFWVGRFVDRHYRRWHTTKSAYSCCWDDIFIFGLPHFWDASNRFGIRRRPMPALALDSFYYYCCSSFYSSSGPLCNRLDSCGVFCTSMVAISTVVLSCLFLLLQ